MDGVRMNMELYFLGTGGAHPSRTRLPSGVALKYGGNILLFDCGEGIQRQFMIIRGVSFMKIRAIFISHFHGDHYLGLFGLMQTMAMNGYRDAISIYGPEDTSDFLYHYFISGYVGFEVPKRVTDIENGKKIPGEQFRVPNIEITPFPLDHSVPTLGYVVEEKVKRRKVDTEKLEELGLKPGPWLKSIKAGECVKLNGMELCPDDILLPPERGRKIVYATDTRPSRRTIEMARGADVLIHDATGSNDIRDKMHQYGHSTAVDAAKIAKRAGVKTLILTHISPRYEDNASILLEEAREVFENTILAEDGMRFEVRR